jgi:hypothetical protein
MAIKRGIQGSPLLSRKLISEQEKIRHKLGVRMNKWRILNLASYVWKSGYLTEQKHPFLLCKLGEECDNQ